MMCSSRIYNQIPWLSLHIYWPSNIKRNVFHQKEACSHINWGYPSSRARGSTTRVNNYPFQVFRGRGKKKTRGWLRWYLPNNLDSNIVCALREIWWRWKPRRIPNTDQTACACAKWGQFFFHQHESRLCGVTLPRVINMS